MDTVRLNEFEGDTIVLHFGGEFASINADTFARSLSGFVQTAAALCNSIDPDEALEFRLVAMGDGSFRAVVQKIKKESGGFLSRGLENLFWGILGAIIMNYFLSADTQVKITVNIDEVVVQSGDQKIVVPRNVYDAAKNAEKSQPVQQGLKQTFKPLQEDSTVSSFGLTKNLLDVRPLLEIPRRAFPIFVDDARVVEAPSAERLKSERARLVILKAWLNHSNRKWSFDWNGMPVSAFVEDESFLDKLQHREFKLGAGDALDAVLVYKENFMGSMGMYIIDHNSFVVTEVAGIVSK